MKSMRHRLLITAGLGLAMVTAAVFFIWPVHPDELVVDHLAGLDEAASSGDMEEFGRHRDALYALGYFEQAGFSVPNQAGFCEALMKRAGSLPMVTWRPGVGERTFVVVTARSEEMPGWQDFMDGWTQP